MSAVYDSGDPRSALAGPAASAPGSAEIAPMQYVDFSVEEPDVVSSRGSRSWVVRARNIVLVLTDLAPGDALVREDVDESMTLVVEGAVSLTAGAQSWELEATSIAMVPPRVETALACRAAARVVQLFATTARDLIEVSRNRKHYENESAVEGIAVAEPWPEPTEPGRVRVHADLEQIPAEPGRMGRIFRNRHAMVNVLYPRVGPRDPGTLSPHSHPDFEQLSLALSGRYVHHIRTPWGKDRRSWRDDEHREIGSPSLAIIAPPLIHTSEAVDAGENRMIDIFAGPRDDFSAQPGWVLNAADFPAPEVSS